MKFAAAILAIAFQVSAVQASGLVTPIYNCYSINGDYTTAVTLKRMQVAAPGVSSAPYYVATARVSNGASSIESGEVRVSNNSPMDAGPEIYGNRQNFSFVILGTRGLDRGGNPAEIYAHVSFADQKNPQIKGRITPRWLTCRQ